MQRRWASIVILSLGFVLTSPRASAETPAADESGLVSEAISLNYVREITHSQISLGMEMSDLSSATDAVIGVGPRVGFDYGLNDKWSLAANFSFAFGATGQPGAFIYSGLNGSVHYSIFGSSVLAATRVRKSDGTEVYSSFPSAKRRVTAMIGLEQLFLNGSTSIYPAVGYLLGGTWTFSMSGREFQADLRYVSLSANNNPLTMIGVGFGMNLTL